MKRKLGRTGIEVGAMGLGCWAIGGQLTAQGMPLGWGNVDDEESIRALNRGLDLGINFLDTADVYGAGHSEKLIAKAIKGKRDKLVIATKFGMVFDSEKRESSFEGNTSPEYINDSLEASLSRLQTDYIDLYQLHIGDLPVEDALAVRNSLEELVEQGKIRGYGWSPG